MKDYYIFQHCRLDADEHVEVIEVLVAEGASVKAGQALVIVKSNNK